MVDRELFTNIWPRSMQWFPRNLRLRKTDACAMTVALLTKVNQS